MLLDVRGLSICIDPFIFSKHKSCPFRPSCFKLAPFKRSAFPNDWSLLFRNTAVSWFTRVHKAERVSNFHFEKGRKAEREAGAGKRGNEERVKRGERKRRESEERREEEKRERREERGRGKEALFLLHLCFSLLLLFSLFHYC